MNLPCLNSWDNGKNWNNSKRRLLFIAEGFEDRTTEWLHQLPQIPHFENAVVFRYVPEKKSRLIDLLDELIPRTKNTPQCFDFFRFDPARSEMELTGRLDELLRGVDEVVIDISVMSKMLIMILVFLLRNWRDDIRIIYTEPRDYAPTRHYFEENKASLERALCLPTFGVHQVVRTPALSSAVMQRSPSLVIAFMSFNEQLIRALLSSINPSRLVMINGRPPRLHWREQAMLFIHRNVVDEFSQDNEIDAQHLLKRTTSTLDYRETFGLLAKEYLENCYYHRIIVAPTGSKLQALACGLFKVCAPEIHVEYPTPESFFIEGYSSKEVACIHELCLPAFATFMLMIGESMKLNG
jgi:hypothetical protein